METEGGGETTVGGRHARIANGRREVPVPEAQTIHRPPLPGELGEGEEADSRQRDSRNSRCLPGSWGGVAKEREGMSKESSKQIALGSPPPSLQALLDMGDGDGGPNLEAGVEEGSVPIERKGICLHQPTRERDPCWGPQSGCGFQQGRSPCPQDRGC